SVLTDIGWNALADAISGKKITYTRMQAGKGAITGGDTQMQGMTALVSPVMYFPIVSYSDDGQGQLTLIGVLSSKNNTTGAGFNFSELAVWATIDTGPELLYTVAYNPTPDYIPASTEASTVIQTVQITVKIDRSVTP